MKPNKLHEIRIPFGKYVGRKVFDLPKGYLADLLNKNTTIDGELLEAMIAAVESDSEPTDSPESNRCQRELSELDQRITRLEEDLVDLREQLSATFEGGV